MLQHVKRTPCSHTVFLAENMFQVVILKQKFERNCILYVLSQKDALLGLAKMTRRLRKKHSNSKYSKGITNKQDLMRFSFIYFKRETLFLFSYSNDCINLTNCQLQSCWKS